MLVDKNSMLKQKCNLLFFLGFYIEAAVIGIKAQKHKEMVLVLNSLDSISEM